MASIQPRGDKFQLRVKHKLLPKPFFYTFDTEAEAQAYGRQLETLLQNGVVPQDLLEPVRSVTPKVVDVIDLYIAQAPVTLSDTEVLQVVANEVIGIRVADLTYQWVEAWVRKLKTNRNNAPGTIRKKVGALARVIDWHLLSTIHDKSGNPLRMLPTGYSNYSTADKSLLKDGAIPKTDIIRDRRLLPHEYQQLMNALKGEKRKDRERALAVDHAFILFTDLILDTGMRLMEVFRLRTDQINIAKRIIHVEGTKGHRGVIKPRDVPLRTAMLKRLQEWCEGKEGLVFPFWNGTEEDQKPASKRLTVRYITAFKYAGINDITERDLRHEATCRWFELRDSAGKWVFSDVEICKIMGWSDYSMILRYASLRGEDLSHRLE